MHDNVLTSYNSAKLIRSTAETAIRPARAVRSAYNILIIYRCKTSSCQSAFNFMYSPRAFVFDDKRTSGCRQLGCVYIHTSQYFITVV